MSYQIEAGLRERIAELEAEVKAGASLTAKFTDKCMALEAENAKLREALEYAMDVMQPDWRTIQEPEDAGQWHNHTFTAALKARKALEAKP